MCESTQSGGGESLLLRSQEGKEYSVAIGWAEGKGERDKTTRRSWKSNAGLIREY